ncbi:dUTP diphosphatase [Bartonella sp. DGB1]|uniref:dUTP diphosphatase n=1 Tax=Bartonella sp. DGB1 TaxID=3239807 RepID=UPI0035250F03
MSNLTTTPVVKMMFLSHGEDMDPPSYETAGASGMDLRAAIDEKTPLILHPMQRVLIPTGIVIELPNNYEAQIRPRSGLALNHGITCLNTPGTIDSDYRGEIQVILINLGQEAFEITRHMRIAQLVIAPVKQAYVERQEFTVDTIRGRGGFGSTGLT